MRQSPALVNMVVAILALPIPHELTPVDGHDGIVSPRTCACQFVRTYQAKVTRFFYDLDALTDRLCGQGVDGGDRGDNTVRAFIS